MRNIFDQYEQPENRLTHALFCTLGNDRRLIRPFLKWLGIGSVPPARALRLVEQQVPGVAISGEGVNAKGLPDEGLPDGCIFGRDDWALLFECKVQAAISRNQLERHLRTAARHGYMNAHVVVIAVNKAHVALPERVHPVEWREVYRWFRDIAKVSPSARVLTEYIEVVESRLIVKDGYLKQGTLTMFDGLKFDEDSPYTNREGKRLIRLLRDELQPRKDLQRLGIHPTAPGRPAITGRGFDLVWDFLRLKQAEGASHTSFPHLTLYLSAEGARAGITIPNGVKGGFRTRLKENGADGFRSLVAELENSLRRARILKKSKGARPFLNLRQRHFASQKSPGIRDGLLEVDMRTLAGCPAERIRRQPEWIDAIYYLLAKKHSNIQLSVEVRFNYECPLVGSREVVDLFAYTWIALEPLLDFVLGA
jgi:hypothetical protein